MGPAPKPERLPIVPAIHRAPGPAGGGPGSEGQATASIPASFQGRARRDAAAFYLTQLAKGVLAGELGVVTGHGQTALVTGEFLILEIEVKQKKRANYVGVKLRWPKKPLIRIAVRGVGRSAGNLESPFPT